MTPDSPFVVGCFHGKTDVVSEAQVSASSLINMHTSLRVHLWSKVECGSVPNNWMRTAQ